MNLYSHVLVLIQGKTDGQVLIQHAARLAGALPVQITLVHISEDYREMNYVSDARMDDNVSADLIQAKALFSELVRSVNVPVKTRELVTLNRFEDVEKCISSLDVDLVLAGHRNRWLGQIASDSMQYVNHLNVDVLIKHIDGKK
ncbi:universal stress protein [Enterobacter sp. Ap-1006]|uniref:universal stress protein n=1 Tax=Enterobacter sp. Ap-1006 TaxID=2608345 RepID=UPI0014246465|nr:universal stress protein [Enterobacter sp. Ap-1006]NIF47106.1 universal stress protein [Enterobacter sp. Ap-1006]